MNVCHVVPGLHPCAGGPSRTVVQLTDVLASQPGISVSLVSQGLNSDPQVASRNADVSRHVGQPRGRVDGALGFPGRQYLGKVLNDEPAELIHIHGIWHPLGHWASQASRSRRIPMVLQPRGMLEPWALAWRSWKKNLALWTYQRRDLESASVLFATAEQEAEGFRRFGLRQPIAVIPNGVELDFATAPVRQSEAVAPNGPRKALFLGRIHSVKNLLNLLSAWAALDSPEWLLQLAGPDEGGHLAEVRQRIAALGLQDRVQYLGSIADAHKGAVYAAADLFILPSFSENFGVVVAEALSHGLPVIATRGTPWRGLEQHGCGWWVEPTVDGLVGALRDAVAKEPAHLREMGMRGQVYAREFGWGNIARQTVEVYRWVLGQGDRPGCVYLD
jgi:glycosyltransferase involved in cell wall biosynthesis